MKESLILFDSLANVVQIPQENSYTDPLRPQSLAFFRQFYIHSLSLFNSSHSFSHTPERVYTAS